MKNILCLLLFAAVISCKKDKEIIASEKIETADSVLMAPVDSTSAPTIESPTSQHFKVIPQDISVDLGKTVFTQNNSPIIYFDEEANRGNIVIDGKNFPLTRFDFMENRVVLSGTDVTIEATDGIFQEMTSDCMYGDFPEVKVTAMGKTLNLANVKIQSCPQY